jgi:hypothetical protein
MPYLRYLKFFLNALCKLPSFTSETCTLWRGVNANKAGQYALHNKYWWWAFSSASTDANVANGFTSNVDEDENQVLMQIHFCSHVVDISQFSYRPMEHEVLLLPARFLTVKNYLVRPGFTLIELVEIETENMLKGINIPKKRKIKEVPLFVNIFTY